MTREEFYDEITSFEELNDFCQENGYEWVFDEILDEDMFSQWVEREYIPYLQRNYDWTDMTDYLCAAKDMYEYYYWFDVSHDDPSGLPSDGDVFQNIRDDVFQRCLNDYFFEDADDEGSTEPETQVTFGIHREVVEEEFVEPESDISMASILNDIADKVSEYEIHIVPVQKVEAGEIKSASELLF